MNKCLPASWNVRRLDEITERGSGHTPNQKFPEYWNGGIKWISLADSSNLDHGEIYNTAKEISELGIKNSSAVLHPKGTVILSRDAGVGKSAIMGTEMAVSQHFIAWRCAPKNVLYNWFFYHWLQFEKGYFEKQAVGSTIKTIGLPLFKKLRIPYPPYLEQKTIADLLSTWDDAIEKTERLITEKEKFKANKLHSLVTNHKPNTTIGSFVKPVIRKTNKPTSSYTALGIRSHFKGTFHRIIEDPNTVAMNELYRVKKDDLILNITFAWEGAITLVKAEDEVCYVSHRFPTYEIISNKAHPSFIWQLLRSTRMKYDLSNISPGGAGRNRVLNKSDFLILLC